MLNKPIPKPVMDTDAEHSEFSPSGSKRWIECPGSVQLCRKVPKTKSTNFYAEEGTAAHELAAFLLENPEQDIKDQIGKKFNGIVVTKEMTKAVQQYIDYIDEAMQIDTTLWIETKIPLFYIKKDQFGTADSSLIFNEETSNWVVEVVDYKHGQGNAVDAVGNTQLRSYACGVLEHLARHDVRFSDYDTVKLTIVQPRAPHPDGKIRSEYVSIADLRDHREVCQRAVKLAESDNPPFGPSEDNCLWCPAKPICKHFAEYNLQLARMEFTDVIETERETDFFDLLPSDDKDFLSKEEFLAIYNHINCFQKWLNSMKEFVHAQMLSGNKIPGLKLVRGRANRGWISEDKLINAFELVLEWQEELGVELDANDLYNSKLKSPNQVENSLDDKVVEILSTFIHKPEGAISVVSENDHRPAIDPNQEAAKEWSDEEF